MGPSTLLMCGQDKVERERLSADSDESPESEKEGEVKAEKEREERSEEPLKRGEEEDGVERREDTEQDGV